MITTKNPSRTITQDAQLFVFGYNSRSESISLYIQATFIYFLSDESSLGSGIHCTTQYLRIPLTENNYSGNYPRTIVLYMTIWHFIFYYSMSL